MSETEFSLQLSRLLMRAGYAGTIKRISLVTSGGNNKAWRVDLDGACFLAKQYFRHAGDSRDRRGCEFEFALYAESCAPDRVAKAICTEPGADMSIFQFLPGRPVSVGDVGADEVQAAACFFAALNGKNRFLGAAHLPAASEACFSIAEHLSLVRSRIEALSNTVSKEQVPSCDDAASFIAELARFWHQLESNVVAVSQSEAIAIDLPLPSEDRCVSPSDFGFHNAIRSGAEGIRFIDFEYAGWDDPAKMIGDFFAQLAVPVSPSFFDAFVESALSTFANRRALRRRAELLRPVYQIKWCCIALNVYLPVHMARRKFANPDLDETFTRRMQLAKAKSLFQSMDTLNHGLH
jgi:hypothetical protein